MSNLIKAPSLGAIVLPLVRIMAEADLAWADREKVSAAIQACHAQWSVMEKERQQANQQIAGQQQDLRNQRL
jgi:hypothetical protein